MIELTVKQLEQLKKIIVKNINLRQRDEDQDNYFFEVSMSTNGSALISWYRHHDATPVTPTRFTLKKTKGGFIGYYHSALNDDPSKNNCLWSISLET